MFVFSEKEMDAGGGRGGWLKPFFLASRAPRFLTKPTQQEVNKLFVALSILLPGWDASLNSPSQCYYPLPPPPIAARCHHYLFIHLGEERHKYNNYNINNILQYIAK